MAITDTDALQFYLVFPCSFSLDVSHPACLLIRLIAKLRLLTFTDLQTSKAAAQACIQQRNAARDKKGELDLKQLACSRATLASSRLSL